MHSEQLARVSLRQVGITAGYPVFDLKITADRPPPRFENRFQSLFAQGAGDEDPQAMGSVLAARPASASQCRKNQNEVPSPHTNLKLREAQCYLFPKMADRAISTSGPRTKVELPPQSPLRVIRVVLTERQ
jgi:hypothetical protein